jgi:hypothetical protein
VSRTDAHVPLHVRVARGDLGHTAVHDHRDGVCDLPDPFDGDALWRGPGHCHWRWLWDGRGLCPCELCHGGAARRRQRRAERQQVRRDLRGEALSWAATLA